jgi:phenylpropionate dioxygenase-like ring-hydroxylating dioxygenase large terminal subunit
MADQKLEIRPGEARCPGPSTRDVILEDSTPTPWPLLAEAPAFLGDADIPYEHYTSREYARLEQERMWSRVWQWACREEQIPTPGSYHVYDIGDRSVLVVRGQDMRIRAFHNFCLHRGTQLKPSGSTGRSTVLRCPFHGWTWSTGGQLAEIPCRWDFPHVRDDDFGLPEVRTGSWGGFVFVTFDDDAPSLEEYLDPLPAHFAEFDIEERYIECHVRKKLPANWKAAAEAFLEAYHVLETHPQGLMNSGDANAQYDVFGPHVTRFLHTTGWPSPHLDPRPTEQQVLDHVLGRKFPDGERPTLAPGERARDIVARYAQQALGERYRRDFSQMSVSQTLDSIEYFAFPNGFFFPGLLISMIYRFRPDGDDPDRSVMDLLILRPRPGDGDVPRPPAPFELDVDDSYTTVPTLDHSLALVYDQDTGNLAAQTKGFKGSKKRAQTLGNYQESRSRHLHQTVDRYIAMGPPRG